MPAPKEDILVFVYGTLRRGFGNHGLLSRARFQGSGRTRDPFALYVGRYPYAAKDEQVCPIAGDLFAVDPATLMLLDALEEHPSVYRRELVAVVLDSGREVLAWMYFHPRPEGRRIDCGDFAADQAGGGR